MAERRGRPAAGEQHDDEEDVVSDDFHDESDLKSDSHLDERSRHAVATADRGRRRGSSAASALLSPRPRFRVGAVVMTTSKDKRKTLGVVVECTDTHCSLEFTNNDRDTIPLTDIIQELSPEKLLRRCDQLLTTMQESLEEQSRMDEENGKLKSQLKKATAALAERKTDSDLSKSQMRKKINDLQKANDRQSKEIRTLQRDKKALQAKTPSAKRLVKELNNERKETTRLRKELEAAQKRASSLKTKLDESKRDRLAGKKATANTSDYEKLRRENVELKKKNGKLRQLKIQSDKENVRLKKQLEAHTGVKGARRDRRASVDAALSKQQKLLKAREDRHRQRYEDAKRKERELEAQMKRLQAKAMDSERGRKREHLELQKKSDAERKRLMREMRMARHERDKLLAEQKEMQTRMQRMKQTLSDSRARRGKFVDDGPRMHRHERRGARQKVLVHHKTRVKEYWNTVEKIRGKRERIDKQGQRMRHYEELVAKLQRKLKKMESSMDDSRKPVKEDEMEDYLDVEEELDQVTKEMDDLALEMHSEGNNIADLKLKHELELAEKDQLIDELNQEIQDLRNTLEDSRSAVSSAAVSPRAGRVNDDDRLANAFEDVRMMLTQGEAKPSDLLEELRGLIRQVAERMDEAEQFPKPTVPNTDELVKDVQEFVDAVNTLSIQPDVKEDELTLAFERCEKLSEETDQHRSKLAKESTKAKELDQEWRSLDDLLQNCRSILEVVADSSSGDPSDWKEEQREVEDMEDTYEKVRHEIEDTRDELKAEDKRTREFDSDFSEARTTLFKKALEVTQAKVKKLESEPFVEERRVMGAAGKDELSEGSPLKKKAERMDDEGDLRGIRSMKGFGKPDILKLKDLRERLERLEEDIAEDKMKLDNLKPIWDHLTEERQQLAESVKEFGDNLFEFKRRPHRKLMDKMKQLNTELSHLSDQVSTKEEELTNVVVCTDERLFDEMELKSELAVQHAQFDYWLKYQPTNEAEMSGAKGEEITSEQKEIMDILDECDQLVDSIYKGIEQNTGDARDQEGRAISCFADIVSAKDTIVEEMEKKLPELNGDMLSEEDAKAAEELRVERKRLCNTSMAKELAGLSSYDSSTDIAEALQKVQCILGAASPVHYHVVADYLVPQMDTLTKDLEELRIALHEMLDAKKSLHGGSLEQARMHLEAHKYRTQLARDLAADYSWDSPSSVLQYDLTLCAARQDELELLRDWLVTVDELDHLKHMYESFLDPSLPQPASLNEENEEEFAAHERLHVAPASMYQTNDCRDLAGLTSTTDHDELHNALAAIEERSQALRAMVFSRGFNAVYQDGLHWRPFLGDDHDTLASESATRDAIEDLQNLVGAAAMEDHRSALGSLPLFSTMDRDGRSQMIKELTSLEWEYAQLLAHKEDDPTQSSLFSDLAEYYRRLFKDPLEDPYLETARENLWGSAMIGQMRKVFNHDLPDDKEALVDAYRTAHTYLTKNGRDDPELMEAVRTIHECEPMDESMFGPHRPGKSPVKPAAADAAFSAARMVIRHGEDDEDDAGIAGAAEPGENYRLDDVRNVLRRHQKNDSDMEVDDLVDRVCHDADKLATLHQSMKKELDSLERKANRYRDERDELQQDKDELEDSLRVVYARLEQTQEMDAELQDLDVLDQLHQNLEELRDEVENTDRNPKKVAKHGLNDMRGPFKDLAEELDSDPLRDAHRLLAHGVDNVKGLSHEKGPLLDVIDDLMHDLDQLIQRHPASRVRAMQTTPAGEPTWPRSGYDQEMDMSYPPKISATAADVVPGDRGEGRYRQTSPTHSFGATDGRRGGPSGTAGRTTGYPGRETTPESPYARKKHVRKFKFERDFPMIERIKIEGPWLNKYPVAEMVYKGHRFRRKLKYFKWLQKMLQLSVQYGDPVPDLGPDLPESHWPESYLKRRKKELNLFLMQCDGIPWIHDSEAYQLFVDPEIENMQRATRDLDKKVIKEYKEARKAPKLK